MCSMGENLSLGFHREGDRERFEASMEAWTGDDDRTTFPLLLRFALLSASLTP
jgi:hypothetical protein